MGFLDILRRKKDETIEKIKEQTTAQPTDPTNAVPPPGRRIKRYVVVCLAFLKLHDGKGYGAYALRKIVERMGFEQFSLDGRYHIELLMS
jgi:hypothetical protein